MADASQDAPAPKKRSLFKRAAWQDAAPNEAADMFSHANEFKDIIAEQTRRREEQERIAEKERKRKQEEQRENKRRKMSAEMIEPVVARSPSKSASKVSRTSSTTRSRTPLSPTPSYLPDSHAASYDPCVQSTASRNPLPGDEPIMVDSDEEGGSAYKTKSFQVISVDDDELEEALDPTLAALEAKARQRAAQKAESVLQPSADGELSKSPVAQLLISPEIPEAKPLMVKVRIDSTIEKPRHAWCEKQGYSSEMIKNIFFTWKGTRIYDSTTIKRLGIQVDRNGNVTVEGDSNIYDDVNLPKVVVEAWTEELFQQRKKEDAAEAAAKKRFAETLPAVEEREATPELVPTVSKIRLILKAKGKEDFRLSVNPNTTFAHIAQAYKTRLKIDKSQPLTLMFDGERLSPLDSVEDTEVEDMDAIEVLLK